MRWELFVLSLVCAAGPLVADATQPDVNEKPKEDKGNWQEAWNQSKEGASKIGEKFKEGWDQSKGNWQEAWNQGKEGASKFGDKAKEAWDQSKEGSSKLGEKAKDYWHQGKQKAVEIKEKVWTKEKTEEKPEQ